MPSNPDFSSRPHNHRSAAMAEKRRSAEQLLIQLTKFAESIAADTTGDGEFDVEFSSSIHTSRAGLLRWIAIHSPVKPPKISNAPD